MCGLFGMAGAGIQTRDYNILDDLMLVSSTRGTDGTGVSCGRSYIQDGPGKSYTHKLAGDPYYWKILTKDEIEKKVYDVSNNWVIGHTRALSVGSVNVQSAQPFAFSNLVGTHNGTLHENYEPFPTDSSKLLSLLDKNIGKVQSVIDGRNPKASYALVWYEYATQSLHFLRSKARSLFFATNKKRAVIYWASEERFLKFALVGEEYEIFYFAEDKHYTLPIKGIKYGGKVDLTYEDINPPTKSYDELEIDYEDVIGEKAAELNDIPWIRDTNQKRNSVKRTVN